MKNSLKVDDLCAVFGNFRYLEGEFTQKDNAKAFSNSDVEIQSFEKPGEVTRRWDTVKNVSDKSLIISCALSRFCFADGDYEVYTQYSEWADESVGGWQPLHGEIMGRSDDIRANCPTPPFFALYNKHNGRGFVFHLLAQGKWQFSVRRRFVQGKGGKTDVIIEIGYSERDFLYELKPNQTLSLPTILYYQFENKTDLDAYKLHRFARTEFPSKPLPIIYNSWMSKFDEVSYEELSLQLDKAKELGAEYFVIDAGWFGAPRQWYDLAGDWEECTDANMKGRMQEFSSLVISSGLKFGLWFEIERASVYCQNVKNHPEFYTIEDDTAFVNFANPKAVDFITDLVSRQIEKYSISFIKFDYNKDRYYDLEKRGFIDYFKGHAEFIKRLRSRFPDIYLECCASGGMRMALSNLYLFDSFWMSDNHSIFAQAKIFKSSILRLPPRCLEKWITVATAKHFRLDYVTRKPSDRLVVCMDAEWTSMATVRRGFLSCASVGGPIGISCDLCSVAQADLDALREQISEYKTQAEFFRSAECRILVDSKDICVMQFSGEDGQEHKLYVFNYKRYQGEITVYPVVDENSEYLILGKRVKGKSLLRQGITLGAGATDDAHCVEIIKI